MPREIDEVFIAKAVELYESIDARQRDFDQAIRKMEVSVRSPDGVVEIVVAGDGTFRDVVISPEAFDDHDPRSLSKAVLAACRAANDATTWASRKLYEETFHDYRSLAAGKGAS